MLEVGNDEIIQAGQRARQQTPEARKIFNERIAEIAKAQPARMHNVIDDTLGTQGKNASVAKIRGAAYQQAEPLFNEVRNMGDLETYEIKQKLSNLPATERQSLGVRTPEEYASIVQSEADKAGVKLHNGTDHFVRYNKDRTLDGRNKVLNTLSDTYLDPDVAADRMYNGQNERIYARKYIGEKPIIDTLYKHQPGVIYQKIPTSDLKYVANKLKGTLDNLSVSARAADIMGISPTSAPYTHNISRLGALVKQNDVVADAIKKVKQSYSSLKKLPDTDANVLIEARKLLSEQSVSPNTTLAFQAKTVLWWL